MVEGGPTVRNYIWAGVGWAVSNSSYSQLRLMVAKLSLGWSSRPTQPKRSPSVHHVINTKWEVGSGKWEYECMDRLPICWDPIVFL